MTERVGFIGLGAMGSGMAANLLAKGWPLTVWAHRNRAAVAGLVDAGAREATTPLALARAVRRRRALRHRLAAGRGRHQRA